MTPIILTLNCGSSSIKFSAFQADANVGLLLRGHVKTGSSLQLFNQGGQLLHQSTITSYDKDDIFPNIFTLLIEKLKERFDGFQVLALSHRIVHGGLDFDVPTVIDDAVEKKLRQLIKLAPLHQAKNLAPLRHARHFFPSAINVGCFDTAFHRDQNSFQKHFALPLKHFDEGVQRYGFHGLSYQFIHQCFSQANPHNKKGKIIIAHLGSGASLCGMSDGKSQICSMGFSVLDGLPMATRCGALDPGAVLYFLQEHQYTLAQLEDLLYRQSGLLALSDGLSGDVETLLNSDSADAQFAIDYLVYHIAQQVGLICASLGGIEHLIFTGGIGENSPAMRQRVCQKLTWLGLQIQQDANENSGSFTRISTADSAIDVWVLATNEEDVLAQSAYKLLNQQFQIK